MSPLTAPNILGVSLARLLAQGGAILKRVLVVCVANSNRSQTAEAFARIHGAGRVEWQIPGPREMPPELFRQASDLIEVKLKELLASL